MGDYWIAVVWALLPTVVILLIFYLILRTIIRADRTERRAYAQIEREERRRRGLPEPGAGDTAAQDEANRTSA